MVSKNMTAEQKIQSAEKFLAWLKRKFPAPSADVSMVYRNTPNLRAGVNASLWPSSGRGVKIEISVGRPAPEVLRSLAHEWKHVLQLFNENIPVEKVKSKQEIAAIGFAAAALSRYSKQFGDNW